MTDSSKKPYRADRRSLLKSGACLLGTACASALGACTRGESLQEAPPSLLPRRGFMNPRPSPWFSMLDNAAVRCRLCPKDCTLQSGRRGPCRVRENRGGTGYSLAYGNPALVQENPVERIPFFHVCPGARTLSVSTAGCNLACKFCEVWDMAQVNPEDVHAYDMPPETIVQQAVSSGVQSVSYAFGEPTVFYEYMLETAVLARKAGLLNLMQSAACIQPEPLRAVCAHLDAANIDLKSFDPAFYRDVVGGELEHVLASLKVIRQAGVHLEITYILIPTLNDDMQHIHAMSSWIAQELGRDTPLHFSRFYPLYQLATLPRTPVSTLDTARATALKAGLEYVYIARVTGHEAENTICPGCATTVIRRIGFVIDESRITGGACGNCGRPIPGRWNVLSPDGA